MENPTVSIILPTYGRMTFLKELFDSVRNSTPEGAYEFVVVSADLPESEKVKWLSEQKDVRLILAGQRKKWQLRQKSLYHFINLGIKEAKKEWICQINDDMKFDGNWYKEFKKIISNPKNSNVGMIIIATQLGRTSMGRRFINIGKIEKNGVWKDIYLSDLNLCKKSVLEEMGLFDENLDWYGSGADNSLAIEFLTTKDTILSEKIIIDHFIAKEGRNTSTEDPFEDFHYVARKWDKWCKENNCRYTMDFEVEPYSIKNRLKHYTKKKIRIVKHYIKYILLNVLKIKRKTAQ